MSNIKLEYIWLDGSEPQRLRSKTKIEYHFSGKLEDCSIWSFDGSSTEQALGGSSDCLLKPVFICKDPQRNNAYLVMCEVLNADGTAHVSNGRATIEDDDNDLMNEELNNLIIDNSTTNVAEENVVEPTQEEITEAWKKKMKEDVDALFADDSTISEEFKTKAATIFEARVTDRVQQIEEQIESKYAGMLEEAVQAIQGDLTEKVDDYLNYVVEQWMEENQIAIESSLRSEITEDFISGLRGLFAEHYIDVPEDKVDLVDELAGQVEDLETKLNEEIQRGIEAKKALVESVKKEITHEVCEGLTDTQVEKIKSLAESVEFSTEDEYKSKLETIRENYFPSGVKKADEQQLHEEIETDESKVVATDAFVAAVSKAITRTTSK